jgi:hypothetical protein
MPKTLYHVWINDDNDTHVRNAEGFLKKRFPDTLAIRTHTSYRRFEETLVEGGYKEPYFSSPGERKRFLRQREENSPENIPSPDLVIQDFSYHLNYEAGVEYCKRSIKDITDYLSSAKVVISTTPEYFKDARLMLQENGWNSPVTGKISYKEGNPDIEKIIADDLKKTDTI